MSSKGYNVPIRNSFAQLDSDAESDYETVPKKVTSEVAAATTQRRERTTRAVNQEPSDARQRSHVEDRPSRGGRGRFRGSSRVAAPLGGEMQPQSPTAIDEEPLAGENLFGNRGRRGVGRADRRGRGFIGRGREFERHSGSGRGREMKKSGAGGYNWGSPVERAENISTMPSNREAPLSDSEQQVPTVEETPLETAEGTSIPEVEKPKAESEEDKYVDFTEWQKTQKQKRAQMLQDKLTTVAGSARPVDAADIEKDGYLLYAREETKEEREAREARMHQDEESTDSDEEKDPQRPKTYNIFDFTGDYGRRGRGGRRGGRGGRGERRPQQPVSLDLRDAAAFPSL